MTISSQATKSYLLKKQEAICEELGNKDGMPRTCGNQALMLQAWGHLEEAMELHKKEQAICEELGDKDDLQACYGNQALILQDWGRFEEAMEFLKKKEAICQELGRKESLAYCHANWALAARQQGNRHREREAGTSPRPNSPNQDASPVRKRPGRVGQNEQHFSANRKLSNYNLSHARGSPHLYVKARSAIIPCNPLTANH